MAHSPLHFPSPHQPLRTKIQAHYHTPIVPILSIRLNQIHGFIFTDLDHKPDLFDLHPTNPNAKSNANNNSPTSQTRLTTTTFLPFILLTSIFLVALIGWCLHGWCSRRPKIHSSDKTAGSSEEKRRGWFSFTRNVGREGEDLVSGPKYVGSGPGDIEDHNKYLGCGYLSGRERTERSFSLVERQGYRYRLSPENDERETSLNANIQAVRSVPLNASPAGMCD